jgi:uncharacterized protein
MKIDGQRESDNVVDKRGMRAGPVMAGGGLLALVLMLAAMYFNSPLLKQIAQQAGQQQTQQPTQTGDVQFSPEEEAQAKLVKVTLASTEDVWNRMFQNYGEQYQMPKLNLFTGSVASACGHADASVGPFYCPGDRQVYIDLSFFVQLEKQLNSPGDFAQAYVVAHEVGHHVQNLLGYSKQVDDLRRSGADEVQVNNASVRLELQADYLAGVWAHHAKDKLQITEEDVREALKAAENIGDDKLQKKAQGYVVPDSFTHGTSEQRMRWFLQGFKTGELKGAEALFTLPYERL